MTTPTPPTPPTPPSTPPAGTPPRANTYHLAGRVALLPGGSGGLGEAVTRAYLDAGATVVVSGSHDQPDSFTALASQLDDPTAAPRLSFVQANAEDESQVERLVWTTVERHGHLDILCNLVGGWSAGQPIHGLDTATWQNMLDLNLRTAYFLAKHAARPMMQQAWGRILHVSSRAARTGRRNAAAYAIAKSAVITLAEVQAEELRDANITVNAILPSIIDTPANRASMPSADFSRWPKAEDIASVLLFLASDDARLISGAAIPVYGLA